VLTNADEVEDDYRIVLSRKDEQMLTGFSTPGLIKVLSTKQDSCHKFIPQTNPMLSKLLSLGIEAIKRFEPDFIWAQYLEPYGVAAYLLSKMYGTPYVFRHAGSDIGRLMLTEQLESLYSEVLKNAMLVLTHPRHHQRLREAGVAEEHFAEAVSTRYRPEVFYPTPMPESSDLLLGVYGKTGRSKGTDALHHALDGLAKSGFPFRLFAHWGGTLMKKYEGLFTSGDLAQRCEIGGFIPHWRMGEFIRSIQVVLFLENRFSITFHQPGVPLEALLCGRILLTTREIADKPLYRDILIDGKNAVIIDGDVSAARITTAIVRASEIVKSTKGLSLSSPLHDTRSRVKLYELLEAIAVRVRQR
jgi:hypothetical protein